MKKEFTTRDIARWKRLAEACYADTVKRDKLVSKITDLQKELESVNARIDLNQATVKMDTNGFTTDDIFNREIIVSEKVDKNGYPIKTPKYVLKYPETIIPPVVPQAAVETREEISDTIY